MEPIESVFGLDCIVADAMSMAWMRYSRSDEFRNIAMAMTPDVFHHLYYSNLSSWQRSTAIARAFGLDVFMIDPYTVRKSMCLPVFLRSAEELSVPPQCGDYFLSRDSSDRSIYMVNEDGQICDSGMRVTSINPALYQTGFVPEEDDLQVSPELEEYLSQLKIIK